MSGTDFSFDELGACRGEMRRVLGLPDERYTLRNLIDVLGFEIAGLRAAGHCDTALCTLITAATNRSLSPADIADASLSDPAALPGTGNGTGGSSVRAISATPDSAYDERALRAAFAEDRYELQFQPQYASRENRLVGVEGLVRLRDRDGRLVPPACFMQAVEQSPLIHDLGLRLFESGCAHAARWPSISVAINVSPAQFRDVELPNHLCDLATKAGVDPGRMEIEVTEGLFFDEPDRAEAALRALHAAGFGIALDDFGTGYSSLGYLLRFPVSKIKIDRSFVTALPHDMKSATIVHALVALGRSLGMKIVAEGVETDEQRLFLRTAGCHILQGYYYAAPLPPEEISALLEAERRTPVMVHA